MPQIGPNIDGTIWKFIQEAHDIDPMDDDSSDTLRHILIQLFRNTLVVHTNNILEKKNSDKRLKIIERNKNKIVITEINKNA